MMGPTFFVLKKDDKADSRGVLFVSIKAEPTKYMQFLIAYTFEEATECAEAHGWKRKT